jgi:hypothetical protein
VVTTIEGLIVPLKPTNQHVKALAVCGILQMILQLAKLTLTMRNVSLVPYKLTLHFVPLHLDVFGMLVV